MSVIIHMSLIRADDFVQTGAVINPYWAQLLSTVDEFDQLMELCTIDTILREEGDSKFYQGL